MDYGSVTAPSGDAFKVSPSNTATVPFHSLLVVDGGDVSVVTEANKTVVFTGLAAGQFLPLRGIRVTVANTTATNIYGFRD